MSNKKLAAKAASFFNVSLFLLLLFFHVLAQFACQIEDHNDPESASGDKQEPIVEAIEAFKGNDVCHKDGGSDADTAAKGYKRKDFL